MASSWPDEVWYATCLIVIDPQDALPPEALAPFTEARAIVGIAP
jgi:hypothetical protein